ncbi:heme/hemin ABC transporter substrate-binding protein [Flavobacterium oreochromis]|uniref:ABC transporter substrate-binding protein n=1 Tax=Flavobacterium columnare TaxID=996 RepID=A0A2D0AI49_9FLAO|nr:ABC transporter substrate-binding protein [Flavobacterium oreochromis]OWP79494.1 ABC transporter substrate-binding protein [Flavobacterium oreochromis]POR28392.1 ABC transporter substrate-binding protein [Flavobacterium columnare]QYS85309.1 ABC transporter substrate-binding protein [Flavobacterium oreochromis]
MRKIILSILTLSFIISCKRFNNEDNQNIGTERIVCIAKQYTEIIFALGAQKDIVAVDLSSTYPAEVKKLPTVGYHRALSAEAILAQKPTLILEDNNIGPEHVVDQLKKLQIPMKQFGEYAKSLEGTDSLITEMGKYFHKEKQAKKLCDDLKIDMDKAFATAKKYAKKPKVLVIHYGQASNVFLVMTSKSVGAKMIEWAGGVLSIQDEKGMKHLSPELVAASDPDVILMTDFGYDKLNGDLNKIKDLPGVASTKAFKNKKIYRIEEHDLVYMGPRTGKNVLLIQELIHRGE